MILLDNKVECNLALCNLCGALFIAQFFFRRRRISISLPLYSILAWKPVTFSMIMIDSNNPIFVTIAIAPPNVIINL